MPAGKKLKPDSLDISGQWYTDPVVLDRFSRDMSAYRILPALVVEPKNVLRELLAERGAKLE